MTRKGLENQLGYSHGKIKYHISQLVKQGVIKHEGATKSGKWVIINKDQFFYAGKGKENNKEKKNCKNVFFELRQEMQYIYLQDFIVVYG